MAFCENCGAGVGRHGQICADCQDRYTKFRKHAFLFRTGLALFLAALVVASVIFGVLRTH